MSLDPEYSYILKNKVCLRGQFSSALRSPARNDVASAGSSHPGSESVILFSSVIVGLECSFHLYHLPIYTLKYAMILYIHSDELSSKTGFFNLLFQLFYGMGTILLAK